ncbi:glucose 1-dehydrogenase [Cupriavidus lacunae]|uniref:3-ketoacyl-ACP reductase n=1 Tax=Cupriavidus lacunae TaxID=2666307 RepID=A0A370NWZ3_9BURK|nr:glucose 1-dehydrogenase [Cupriavidus lacunae]RDK10105.1 3-ketoacyl-ACP reductase [Cupriavidus lacunae]
MRLKDKVAIVTGASSGLGQAMALRFAREGARVLAVARRADKLEEIAARAADYPGGVVPFRGDMRDKDDIRRMVAVAVERFGRLDVLVNNAGINDDFSAVADMKEELWHDVFALNLDAAFLACKFAVPHLIERRGNIINIASIGGTEYGRSGVAYTASKHALVAMTKHTAFNYAPTGLRCNVICPGPVETPMVQAAMEQAASMNRDGARRANSGMKNLVRIGEPEEISNIACFLASDEASLLNGAVVVADAGWTSY